VPPLPNRQRPIDVVRGACMSVLVVEVVLRFFLHDRDASAFAQLARALSGIGGPAVVAIAGASMELRRGRTTNAQLARFMASRGLLFMALDIVVLRLAWRMDPFFERPLLELPFTIGAAFLLTAPTAWLPAWATATLGVVIVGTHDLFDRVDAAWTTPAWTLLHVARPLHVLGRTIVVSEPILPWWGLLMSGFGLGRLFVMEPQARQRIVAGAAIACLAAFASIRGLTRLGDPHPWDGSWLSVVPSGAHPPSLTVCLLALAMLLGALVALDRGWLPRARAKALEMVGRTAAFAYGATLVFCAFAANAATYVRWGQAGFDPSGHDGHPEWPVWASVPLALVVVALLPTACGAFEEWAIERAWLSYLRRRA
jgi:uncharacterized membrane protein